jgi:hypothetical protein
MKVNADWLERNLWAVGVELHFLWDCELQGQMTKM